MVFSGEGDLIQLDTESYAQLEHALANAKEHDVSGGEVSLTLDFDGRSITFEKTGRGDIGMDDFRVGI